MNEMLLVLGMMLVTFGVRYPVLAFVGKIPLSGVGQARPPVCPACGPDGVNHACNAHTIWGKVGDIAEEPLPGSRDRRDNDGRLAKKSPPDNRHRYAEFVGDTVGACALRITRQDR